MQVQARVQERWREISQWIVEDEGRLVPEEAGSSDSMTGVRTAQFLPCFIST